MAQQQQQTQYPFGIPPPSAWPQPIKELYNNHFLKTIRPCRLGGEMGSSGGRAGGKAGGSRDIPQTKEDLATSVDLMNLSVFKALSDARDWMQSRRLVKSSGSSSTSSGTAEEALRQKDVDEIFICFLMDEFEVCCNHYLLFPHEKVIALQGINGGGGGNGNTKKAGSKKTKIGLKKTEKETDFEYLCAQAKFSKELPVEFLLRFLALLPDALSEYRVTNQTFDANKREINAKLGDAFLSRGDGGNGSGGGAGNRESGGGEYPFKFYPTPALVTDRRTKRNRELQQEGETTTNVEPALASSSRKGNTGKTINNNNNSSPTRASDGEEEGSDSEVQEVDKHGRSVSKIKGSQGGGIDQTGGGSIHVGRKLSGADDDGKLPSLFTSPWLFDQSYVALEERVGLLMQSLKIQVYGGSRK